MGGQGRKHKDFEVKNERHKELETMPTEYGHTPRTHSKRQSTRDSDRQGHHDRRHIKMPPPVHGPSSPRSRDKSHTDNLSDHSCASSEASGSRAKSRFSRASSSDSLSRSSATVEEEVTSDKSQSTPDWPASAKRREGGEGGGRHTNNVIVGFVCASSY